MTRFVVLITALESLTIRKHRDELELSAVEELVTYARTRGFSASLRSELGRLKYLSIGATCQALVEEVLTPEDAAQFGPFYAIRSKYLHDGLFPSDEDLCEAQVKLDHMVGRILWKRLVAQTI